MTRFSYVIFLRDVSEIFFKLSGRSRDSRYVLSTIKHVTLSVRRLVLRAIRQSGVCYLFVDIFVALVKASEKNFRIILPFFTFFIFLFFFHLFMFSFYRFLSHV